MFRYIKIFSKIVWQKIQRELFSLLAYTNNNCFKGIKCLSVISDWDSLLWNG